MAMLYYVRHDSVYQELRNELEEAILDLVDENPDRARSAECTMIVLDTISCPDVSEELKHKLAQLMGSDNHSSVRPKALCEAIERQNWFIDWRGKTEIAHALLKKELKSPYSERRI